MSLGVPLTSTEWRNARDLRVLTPSHDGQLVVGAGTEVRIWRADDGRVEAIVDGPLDGLVWHACFSLQDTFVGYSHGRRVSVWSLAEGRVVFDAPWHVRALIPDGDHGFLAVVAEGDALEVREVPSGVARRGIARDARAVALSPDGATVALARRDGGGQIEIFRGDAPPVVLQGAATVEWTEERLGMWDEYYTNNRSAVAEVQALAFDPAGARLASGGNEAVVRVWDAQTGALLAARDLGNREVGGLAWSPDGATLAATFAPLIGATAPPQLWRLPENTVAEASPGGVVAFWGGLVAVGGGTSRIHTGPAEHDGAAIIGLAVHPAGRVLVVRSQTGTEAWSVPAAGEVPRRLWRDAGPTSSYTAIAFGPADDGWTTETLGSEFGVRRFRLDTGFTPTRLAPVPTLTWALEVSRDGRYLFVAGYNDPCAIWDIAAGAVVARLIDAQPHAIKLVPGGAWVADPDGTLKRYAWEGDPRGDLTPTRVLTPTGPGSDAAPNDDAHVLAISDDETVAVSGWNDVVRVWDLVTGQVVATSALVDRFATVRIVGLHPAPFGVVFRRTQAPDGGEAWGFTAEGGDVRLLTSTDPLWRYAARGCPVPGGGIVITGPDGVPRRHVFP